MMKVIDVQNKTISNPKVPQLGEKNSVSIVFSDGHDSYILTIHKVRRNYIFSVSNTIVQGYALSSVEEILKEWFLTGLVDAEEIKAYLGE